MRSFFLEDFGAFEGFGEAGPAAAAIEFIEGGEEGFAGDDVDVDAFFFAVVEFAGEGAFGAAFLGDLLLERGEFFDRFLEGGGLGGVGGGFGGHGGDS